MTLGSRFWGVAAGGCLLLAAGTVLADSSPRQGERFPPPNTPPIAAPAVAKKAAPAVILGVDARVESSELGFERGIAPAPGRTVSWKGTDYQVVDVSAVGGGPTFSAGSRHVIAVQGGRLTVALKYVDPESTIGAGTAVASRSLK
ncbi:MAG: hypothetical protein KIT25_04095 [Enhydrobacter sp.]|nr:MAG: hypothetical protein KIT25_04095 [Enhydrobacter sp.]